uniref:Myosin IXA n=1 Tax=Anabas testudineus TaxID=64144 RepID=A0A7N6BP97_ANATE
MSLQDGSCSYASSANMATTSGSMRRRLEDQEFTLRVYPGALADGTIYCPVTARKNTTAAEAIECLIERLHLDRTKCYVLAEVKEFGGEEWILNPGDCPVQRMMLWPRNALENRSGLGSGDDYRFLLREKNLDGSIHYGGSLQMWLRVTEERRCMVERGFLPQPAGSDPPSDLCALPELTERALLESLRARFRQEKIYTYVGSILIVINPFQFLPIYNPKYVKLYDNHTLGKLEPHIYAVADVAYHAMLQRRRNQCIVISGESGSGKTQSTNFLIHHLTALSQKGFASGVEQIILGAGPVLEAFGNAKTAHNNNSSRFGKFIQVNYQESGTVRGAYVEKYLLEKSRLVYQEHNERNYHVFYYLLAGASEEERKSFHLLKPEEYHYLNQMTKKSLKLHWDNYYESELDCFTVEGEDLKHDFERLQLAMEMVGFLPATRKQIFSLLSAILHLGNIRYKKKTYRDDSIDICNPEVLPIVSELLEVKEEMLLEALTTRKTVTVGERLIVPYKLAEAGTVRDSMAKSLYSALFDWIVFRTNHALLNNKDLEDNSKILSIGVLDIFGFEDYENNSFEQFCINFANERLQHYFNQHIFKLEQEEYRAEGITWHNIEYSDNSGCINLISKKPTALFHLLDEECNFPQASNQTLLDKFKRQHEGNSYIEFPAVMEPAFIISHYAGKVKYGVKDFREKNTDHMRPDIVALLKSSKNAFICGLMGIDPVATFRWAVLRAYFRAMVAFREAGRRHTHKKTGNDAAVPCAVVKTVDSFSFLHHPVHQRSLEILQRCKDEKYSITRKNPRTPLSDLQGTNALNEKASWRNRNCKSKPTLPKHLLDVKSLRYLSSVTLHDRITKSLLHLHKKKKPPSISAQFQASLNKLMETLNQSEPYFVKCIRSNAEKLPLRFNDSLVLRQLRYTGMLETVRIRQSGYSIKYTFQDFVRHFHVLLPRGTSPTKSGIRDFFRQIHLPPAGYQVGNTMVFLREVERQRLQTLLHQEVLRRIVTLQRRFRAVLERKHFVSMRRSACVVQVRCCNRKNLVILVPVGAVVCLQAAWRSYRERRKFLQWRDSAIIIQRSWRNCLCRRSLAALTIQSSWRGFRERKRYCQTYRAVTQLQAMSRAYLAQSCFQHLIYDNVLYNMFPPLHGDGYLLYVCFFTNDNYSFRDLKEQHERQQLSRQQSSPADMEEGTMEDVASSEQEDSEISKSTDETSHKNRSKRESRRMRELEQAQFSLELLKVRNTSVGGPVQEDSAPDNSTSQLCDHHRHSPRGSPASHGSFELLNVEDMDTEGSGGFSSQSTVGRPGPKKKARMSRTRSDFLTRCNSEGATQSDDDDEYYIPAHSRTLPPFLSPPRAHPEADCHSDSEMVKYRSSRGPMTSKQVFCPLWPLLPLWTLDQAASNSAFNPTIVGLILHPKKIHKTMSSGDLGKVEVLRKTSSQDGSRMRGKMRFWSKTKHSEKKLLREKQTSRISNPSFLHLPAHFAASSHGVRDSKENKELSPKMRRRRSVKISSITLEPAQWQNDALHILTSAHDYRSMNDFLMKKIADLDSEDSKKDTMVDVVFKKALKEFRINIFNSYSTALAMDDGKSIRYKDLYALFEHILEKTMRLEQRDWSESPVKVWVNTFKVFLDEFMTEFKPMEGTIGKAPKRERKKSRKKETDIVEEHNGHIFKSTQYSIPTYCEYCSSLIWMMDRACVCKCLLVIYFCVFSCVFVHKYDPELSSRQFGVELSRLTSEERMVPQLVEKLINYIEMHGLYTEGIYRKSGSTNKIKELRQGLDTDVSSVNLDDYNIHVIASVLKQWLRDLPSPLMTFELYEEFLRAMGQPDKREVIRGVYSVIDQLSRTHLSTLERLIFHLVRIALQEETNRMSANALAIVFAPCILRCPDTIDPLQSVQDISKTTACVELIINEQMGKYKARLKDISSLEFAESKAKSRLTHIRRSMVRPDCSRSQSLEEGAEAGVNEQQHLAMQQEERILTEQIESLQKEKEELTYEMLILEPRASDDETPESEASIGTADSSENITMETEGATSDPSERGTYRSRKSDPKSRRTLRRQPDSQDSADSTSTISSSYHPSSSFSSNASGSPSPHYRFRSSSSGPLLSSCGLGAPLAEAEGGHRASKTRHRLRLSRSSPREPSGGHRRDSDFSSGPQQLVLYGSNEFMV